MATLATLSTLKIMCDDSVKNLSETSILFQAATLSHCPSHRKVTFAVTPTLIRDNTTIITNSPDNTSSNTATTNNLLDNTSTNTKIVFCQNTSDSHCNGCVASEKSKSRHKSQSNRVRTEKVECQKEDDDDRRLLFSDKQEEGKLTWLEVEDSGRGSCSDESQVLSLVDTTTIISGRKVSPSTGEDDESAYCYAYSNPNQTKPSCSNPNPTPPPSSNLHPVSSWQNEEVGNIYEEIRPLKKTSSSSDQVTKEKSREESAQSDLVLNISPRKLNRQQFYRLVSSDALISISSTKMYGTI